MLTPAIVPVPGVLELLEGVTVTEALAAFALVAVILPEAGVVTDDVLTGNVALVEP